MHALDWICAALLLASLLLGAWRGLLYEVLAIAGWVLAFFAARWAAPGVGQWLPMGESPPELRYAAGFVLVFIATAFACGMLASLARRAARAVGARPVDRLLGAAFGALRGVALLLVLGFAVGLTPMHEEDWWQDARSAQWLQAGLDTLAPWLPERLQPAPVVPDAPAQVPPPARATL
ncbi:MAG: CvpA family protein [Pseudomonadota bacterium]|nr:CvpA family protein [Pseudomonadota bacterium]